MREAKKYHNLIIEKEWGGGFNTAGRSDINGCYHGRCIKIEIKNPGEEPTQLQAKYMRDWAKAGAITGCAHSWEEFKDIIQLRVEDERR